MTAELAPLKFEVPTGERLLIRANPFGKDSLESNAKKDFIRRQRIAKDTAGPEPVDYRISVYARRRKVDEPNQKFFEELVEHALHYLPGTSKIEPVLESELNVAQFSLELSEPPADHYDIVLGVDPEKLRSQELSDVFNLHERIKVQ